MSGNQLSLSPDWKELEQIREYINSINNIEEIQAFIVQAQGRANQLYKQT